MERAERGRSSARGRCFNVVGVCGYNRLEIRMFFFEIGVFL